MCISFVGVAMCVKLQNLFFVLLERDLVKKVMLSILVRFVSLRSARGIDGQMKQIDNIREPLV